MKKRAKSLFKKKYFWITVAIIVAITVFLAWLYGTYQPPFPPRWVGIKYYHVSLEEPITLGEITTVTAGIPSIQSSILVFEPKTNEAKKLLPEKVAISTFTLSQEDVIRLTLEEALAQRIAGTRPENEAAARAVLSDAEGSMRLVDIIVAVTQSNNIPDAQELADINYKAQSEEMSPKDYDEIMSQLKLAGTLQPDQGGNANNTAGKQLEMVDKQETAKFILNAAALESSASAALKQPYNEFAVVNGGLIPFRGGRSPLLILDKGSYAMNEGMQILPIRYYLSLATVNGLPFCRCGVGHGWASVSKQEDGTFYPLMTMSLFNSLDTDNKQNVASGEFTNIATFTNLWINHPDDWTRATKILNRIPLPDGPSRARVMEIAPETARKILFERRWYFPQYSTQEYYTKYLQESMAATNDSKTKLTLAIELLHLKYQNIMNETFWGTIQMLMNGTVGDTRYNGAISNCVAYSTAFWNSFDETVKYDPRMLKLVNVPGKLYVEMDPSQVIDLPDADTLPEDQQNVPYETATTE